jgi:hypothetical protein
MTVIRGVPAVVAGPAAGGSGAWRLICNPPTAGAIGGGGADIAVRLIGCVPRFSLKRALAAAVPSTLQTGQFTVNGIRPFTGSTSNLYF